MDRERFWTIVNAARQEAGEDDELFLHHVEAAMQGLSRKDLVAFDRVLDQLMAESYRNDQWAAAYIIKRRLLG